MDITLTAEALSVARGDQPIFLDISFCLRPGGALAITGPNGAGKTTLLRAVAGFLPLAGGALRVTGAPTKEPLSEQCHYVGHANAVKSTLTACENVLFWARYLNADAKAAAASARARAASALERWGLAALAEVPAGYLSAGQKRRLGLARLLAAQRPIWLLDEPGTSLDAGSTLLLRAIVAEHLAQGGLALIATHVPLDLPSLAEVSLRGAA